MDNDFRAAGRRTTQFDYFAKNRRLAVDTLGRLEQERAATGGGLEVWGDWRRLAGFPAGTNDGPADRYQVIHDYLQQALNARPHPTHPQHRLHPDLNGDANGATRAWLLRRILNRLVEQAQPGYVRPRGAVRLPEDLPKAVADINLLRLHHQALPPGPQRGLQHYGTIEALGKAVTPWRAQYPITDKARLAAHRAFLRLNDPVTGAPMFQGNGAAELLGILADGTEVIRLGSEKVSRAYGSPRWCTAYRREETSFEDYKDDLIVVIDPAGERWQIHLRTAQFNDADDQPIENVPAFIKEHKGLAELLAPAFNGAIDRLVQTRRPDREEAEAHFRLFRLAADIPAWQASLSGKFFTKLFDMAVEHQPDENDPDDPRLPPLALLETARVMPGCHESLARSGAIERLLTSELPEDNYRLQDDAFGQRLRIFAAAAAIPALGQAWAGPGKLSAIVAYFVDQASERNVDPPWDAIADFLRTASANPDLRTALAVRQGVPALVHRVLLQDNWAVIPILAAVNDVPEWVAALVQPDALPRTLQTIANRDGPRFARDALEMIETAPALHQALQEVLPAVPEPMRHRVRADSGKPEP